jgi:hypothetical protein
MEFNEGGEPDLKQDDNIRGGFHRMAADRSCPAHGSVADGDSDGRQGEEGDVADRS